MVHAIKLTIYTEDSTCYTSRTYTVAPILPPNIQINIDKRTLCVSDDDPTVSENSTITDLTERVRERRWEFADTSYGNRTTITRNFTEFENPFMLIVTGLNGCIDTLYDTIYFFHDPEVTFSNDTIVCNGHEAHVTASTPVSGCSFAWFRHNNQAGETPIYEGNTLYVRPTQEHTRYYLRITANSGCVLFYSVYI